MSVDETVNFGAATRALALASSLLFAILAAGSGCDDESTAPGGSSGGTHVVVFSGENNRLNAYDPADGFRKQTVVPSSSDDPAHGRDLNGQICFTRDGSRRFIAGEDTGQPNPPQGWGFFQLSGTRVGELSAVEIGKLTPTYQGSLDNAENYGCGFLSDGRLLTTDVGNQASGESDGQLIIWFPPFDHGLPSTGEPRPRYCKLDVAIGTAGGIAIDSADRLYVGSARNEPGVYRYSPPYPTSDTAAGGCGGVDGTGAPLADHVAKELFIQASSRGGLTPNAPVITARGTFFVSSVSDGLISEFDGTGNFIRRVLVPIAGEMIPFPSSGTPLGLGLGPDGTIYYADIGLSVSSSGDIGPQDGLGHVRRLRFVDGVPQAPEIMDSGLAFPDGIGVIELPSDD